MNRTAFFLILICLALKVWSQDKIYIPPQNGLDTSIYQRYSKKLLAEFRDDSGARYPTERAVAKHNVYVCYYHLKAPKDTVFRYIDKSLNFDPIYECDCLFKNQYSFFSIAKSTYPNEFKKLKFHCDSVWNTLDSILIDILSVVDANDSKYRTGEGDVPWRAGNEYKWIEQRALDSVNQAIVHHILKRGYPTSRRIGMDLIEVPFYVIQHADLKYQEEHIGILSEAVNKGIIRKNNMAYLIDRMLMRKKLPQRFGTQLIYNKKKDRLELYKVENLEKIDQYREEYGLNKLVVYLKDHNAIIPDKNN